MISSLVGYPPPSFHSLYPVGASRYHSTLDSLLSTYFSFDNKRFNAAYGSTATAADGVLFSAAALHQLVRHGTCTLGRDYFPHILSSFVPRVWPGY